MPLSEPQGDRALAALRRRLQEVHAGDVAALARELRALASVLAQVLSGRVLCPRGLALALARIAGMTMEQLLAGPREEAAQLAREAGIAEGAIARVLAEPEPLGYRPPLYYVDRMREVARLGDGSGEIVGGVPPSRRAG